MSVSTVGRRVEPARHSAMHEEATASPSKLGELSQPPPFISQNKRFCSERFRGQAVTVYFKFQISNMLTTS